MHRLSMTDLPVIGLYTRTVPSDLERVISKRNACLENLPYKTPGDDLLSTGRRSSGR